MKKVLALVLAFTMVFSSISFAFADTTPVATTVAKTADAIACETLGMVKGTGGEITAAYYAEESTRLQAAIMVLRLKGLEAEALAFVGEKNFADMATYAWAGGKNIAAYLLAHPELGFIGDGVNFNADQKIDEASFYKVMLTALGYKQTTAEVVGDYAWADVLTFAKSLGLAPQAPTAFTNNDIARITIEALKAKNKDGVVLVDALVAAGALTAEKVAAAGINVAAPVVAAVDTVTAIGNTIVEVVFEEDVDAAVAGRLANYAIEGLEVKSVAVVDTDIVRLETAAQTLGKIYNLTVGNEKVKFAGSAKITGALELDKAEGTDTERVELTFDKVVDFATGSDVANYAIANIKIVKAVVDGKTVTLTTEGLVTSKSYTVKVTNVKSVDGGLLKSASKTFLAKSDKTAPKLESAKALTNTRVLVKFNEKVTVASATNVDNYKITAGTTELAIESIVMVTDSKTSVEITTAPQKSGTKYELAANNIVDRKVLANTMTKESTKNFYGKLEDKNAPVFKSFEYLSKNLVVVTFEDGSRLDFTTATDANNYTFNNDIDVESAVMEDADDKDCKVVLLSVSDLEINKLYKLSIADVADEFGNAIEAGKTSNSKSATFKSSDLTATRVDKVVANEEEIVVTFTKKLNSASAEDIANYSVNNSVLAPIEAEYDVDARTVTLTPGTELTAGKTYKLTIDGLSDLAGNKITSTSTFVASSTSIDTEAPEVEYIEALNNRVIAVTFNEEMSEAGTIKLDLDADTVFETTLVYVDSSEDDTVLYFAKANRTDIFATNTDGRVYNVEYQTNIVDVARNPLVLADILDDLTKVYANTEDVDDVELEGVEQTQVNEFKLIFSGKIDETTVNNMAVVAGQNSDYAVVAVTPEIDEDDATIVYVVGNFKLDKTYKLQLQAGLTGIYGETVAGEYQNTAGTLQYVDLYAALEDEDAPVIEKVVAKYNNKVVVTYNEFLRDGSYRYEIFNDEDKSLGTFNGDADEDEVSISINNGKLLLAGEVYTLVAKSVVYDIAGNKTTIDLDDKYDFEGTNLVAIPQFVTVNVVNRGTIKVVTSTGDLANVVMSVYNDSTFVDTVTVPAGTETSYTATFANAVFVDGVEYTLKLNGVAKTTFTGLGEVFLSGLVDDGAAIPTPEAGVKVTLIKVVGAVEEDVDSVLTNNAGEYSFSVTNATYKLRFEKDNYTTFTTNAYVVTDADAVIDVTFVP